MNFVTLYLQFTTYEFTRNREFIHLLFLLSNYMLQILYMVSLIFKICFPNMKMKYELRFNWFLEMFNKFFTTSQAVPAFIVYG